MIIASLLGRELFAYLIRFDDDGKTASILKNGKSPRFNFDNFYNAIITIFILLTGESWNQITY